jgi:hypothetical protein
VQNFIWKLILDITEFILLLPTDSAHKSRIYLVLDKLGQNNLPIRQAFPGHLNRDQPGACAEIRASP